MTVAAILAGGQGRRLGGVCKPLLVVDGVTILDRQLAVLRPRVSEVLLLVADLARWQDHDPILRLVVDEQPGLGPLGGLSSAFSALPPESSLLLVAGDLPYLTPALIDALLADDIDDVHDAVVPRPAGRAQPLCARYGPRVRSVLKQRLEQRQLRATALLDDLNVRYLDDAELTSLNPGGRALFNINTPADLDDSRPMR